MKAEHLSHTTPRHVPDIKATTIENQILQLHINTQKKWYLNYSLLLVLTMVEVLVQLPYYGAKKKFDGLQATLG